MDPPVLASEDDDSKAATNKSGPETPKNKSIPLPTIKSTPFNVGSASQAQQLTLGRIEDVEHYFRVDLDRYASNAKLNNFLVFLLSCTTKTEEKTSLKAKLAQLLDVALSVCLAPLKAEGSSDESMPQASLTEVREANESPSDSTQNCDGARIRPIWRDYLEKYAVASPEDKRYDPFVQLTNSILQTLREAAALDQLKTIGLAANTESPSRIIFQRNDPKYIIETYSGHAGEQLSAKVKRKPDVVVLGVHDAVRTHAKQTQSPHSSIPQDPDILFSSHANQAPKIPLSGPPFSHIKMCFEFKKALGRDELKPLIPSTYAKKEEPEEILPQTWKAADDLFKAATDVKSSPQITTHRSSLAYEQSESSGTKKRPLLQDKGDQSSSSSKKHKASNGSAKRLPAGEPSEDVTDRPSSAQIVRTKELSGPIQSAIYAGGKLSSSVFADHTLNAVVVDHVLWLWWYDHGGAIQSYGLNFFGDLPYFVALLAILDHFDDESWDLHTAFSKTDTENNETSAFDVTLHGNGLNKSNTPFRLGITRARHYSYYGLFGRGTSILDATSSAPSPLHPATNLRDVKMIAKVYHPEESRVSEVDLLKTAYAIAGCNETDPDGRIRGHLPLLVASRSWGNRYSKQINDLLEIDPTKRQTRSLRILVFVKLYAIFELKGNDFLKAFADCMFCHWGLARNRVLHRDISVNNLMYYKTSTGQVMGVLIDFDLSIIEGLGRDEGLDRTGTVPYMAYRLLKAMMKNSRIPHIYEYDFESFYYVLVWITCRYNGSLVNEKVFADWGTAKTFGDAADRKLESVLNPDQLDFTEAHPMAAFLVWDMSTQVGQCRGEQVLQDLRRSKAVAAILTWKKYQNEQKASDSYQVLNQIEFRMREAAENGLLVLEKEDASERLPATLERGRLVFDTIATKLDSFRSMEHSATEPSAEMRPASAYSACMESLDIFQTVRTIACNDWRNQLHAVKVHARRLPEFLKSIHPHIFVVS